MLYIRLLTPSVITIIIIIIIIIIIVIQRAKKVVSNSAGLVDFAIGLVNSVINLPNVQVKYFEEFNLQKNCETNSVHQKILGASWNDVWASKC